jgi:PAS domain S-box-containing protein
VEGQPISVPQSESEWERLFDLSHDLICIAGFDGYFKRVNRAFERTLGYPTQELLSRPLLDVVHPDDLQASRDVLADLERGEDVIGFVSRVICADGSLRWLEWNTRTMPGDGFVYGIARDVTDRLHAEADLRDAQGLIEASREEFRVLAAEQAALRRVATLVARGSPPETVFAAVTEEVGQLLGTHLAGMARYESDDTLTVVATWAAEGEHGGAHPLVPGPWPLEGGDLASTIWRTGQAVRIDDYNGVPGRIAAFVRDELGIASSLGSPIVVEGHLWGCLFVHSRQADQSLPADGESRLTGFTELAGTAVANAEGRAALAASRARIVAATDETRRRIERDLHDGIQQRLVSLGLELRAAQATVPPQFSELESLLARIAQGLASAFDELREISRGVHPAILSEGGLELALRSLCRRSAVPVELDLHAERRLPEPVEVAAYYVVSEALTNAAKHAHASAVRVELDTHDAILQLAIRDDGAGGADPGRGSGLVGLGDRIEALGGTLQVTSPVGSGTTLLIELPLEDRSRAVSLRQ